MPAHFKALLVVLVVTAFSFWVARPVFTRFMADEDFVRRRNLWLGLTLCIFVVPSFWWYMGIAGVLIARAATKDPNPAALYLFLLFAVPPFQMMIPGGGVVGNLFSMDHFRLLGLVLILPAAITLRRAAAGWAARSGRSTWLAADILLVIYAALQVLIYAPIASMTDSLRGVFLLTLDILLPFYVLSRSCNSTEKIVEAMAALSLAAMVLAPLALFETSRAWLLYGELPTNLQLELSPLSYLLRGDTLRAQVTSGQSIVLGNLFAVILGLWLYLQARLTAAQRWLGTAAVLTGLLCALARGPWLGAVACVVAFCAVGPGATTRLLKLTGVSAAVIAAILMLPIGEKIISLLPFIGTVDEGNISYRREVMERSILLIQQNPLFGSPNFIGYMEDLRQGEGIIDLLNAYLNIGLAYGLVTLAVFLAFLAVVIVDCLKATRMHAQRDADVSRIGVALFASLAGTLLTINTLGNFLSVPYVYFGLAALMVAYSRTERGCAPYPL